MSRHESLRHPLSILVIDDLVDVAESEADLLALHGYRAQVALDGAAALRCVTTERPDVVLLDIRMPGPDGCEVARRIREACAGGPQPILVAVTGGCGGETDRLRSADAGFDLHLVKPVDPQLLVGMVERFNRLLSSAAPAPSDWCRGGANASGA